MTMSNDVRGSNNGGGNAATRQPARYWTQGPRQRRLATTHGMYRGDNSARHQNVGEVERIVAGVCGAGLVMLALTRKHTSSLVAGILGGGALIARSATGYCPMYDALGIQQARLGKAQPHDFQDDGIHVQIATTIDKTPEELYRFWRNFENLPRFMAHLESVKVLDDRRSHWVAKAPMGKTVEWDAEIINEERDRLIAWRSLEGADVDNAGSVRFVEAPEGRGTEVRVTVDYLPPAGRIGQFVAKLFGEEPEIQIREDLRRFKRLMETGEIPTTEGQPQGTCK